MNYKISICCPSYKRAEGVKVIKYLQNCKVYADGSEFEEYKRCNPNANIIKCKDGVQGNVARVRNYILDTEFENGADAVCIVDDDLYGIVEFSANKETGFGYERRKLSEEEVYNFICKYTGICDELGYKLWGININKDSLSYKHNIPFSFTSIILGPFSVHLKNKIRYDEKLPLKEDYDMAIQHLNKYRGILRVNFMHYECLQSENKGGCATIRNVKREKEQFRMLQKKWGSKIVKQDFTNKGRTKMRKDFDYNPIIRIPIRGV